MFHYHHSKFTAALNGE